ncbi:MFS transporter [Candidatus Parabeggiatoa sp. HSG14]|uniref:MFS transporter n=1 Tax=Candidatus Parabeggiatoa sp. HSG14 TaxID=3055593 RepID=UPI0032E5196A
MSEGNINLFNLKSERIRMLHFTWFAFFISFYIWFNMAPLMDSIRALLLWGILGDLDVFKGILKDGTPFSFTFTEWMKLSFADMRAYVTEAQLTEVNQQIKVLMILNVAMTIPSRIIIGMLVDKFGPRIMFSLLLSISGVLCIIFSMAQDFQQLAIMRFLLAFVGGGFVIGIRMIGEWFPAKQVGLAEGIYGGWGNFGSAGAALTLPTVAFILAALIDAENGWRYSLALSGLVAIVYSGIYYLAVRDTPKGSTYFKPNKTGAMEITSPGDFVLYLVMNIPLYLALAVLTWKLSPSNLTLLTWPQSYGVYGFLVTVYFIQTYFVYQVNKEVFTTPVPEIHRYKFKQVAVLNLSYFCTFGSELAVVSMLPLFYLDMFTATTPWMNQVYAGLIASSYAFVNLIARPVGGFFSDRFGRKKALIILLGGLAVGYVLMNLISASWFIIAAIAVTMFCSFFVMAGEGAVFAMVPLIKRRMTGQIAGMTGAYGNVGAVIFLTVLSFVPAQQFFLVIGGSALIVMVLVAIFLDEPKGQMAEVLPDGTVQMIDVH